MERRPRRWSVLPVALALGCVVGLLSESAAAIQSTAPGPQTSFVDTTLRPPVIRLAPAQWPRPTPGFLLKQGLVSVGLQAALAGVTALIVSLVTPRVVTSNSDVAGDVLIIMASALPTTLAYLFVPSIVLAKMAGRSLGSIYFQRVFWASGLASITWTLAILAWPMDSKQSLALPLTFGIGGILLTAAAQVWMGYMDWDSDPPPVPATPAADPRPAAHAAAGFRSQSLPPVPGIALWAGRF